MIAFQLFALALCTLAVIRTAVLAWREREPRWLLPLFLLCLIALQVGVGTIKSVWPQTRIQVPPAEVPLFDLLLGIFAYLSVSAWKQLSVPGTGWFNGSDLSENRYRKLVEASSDLIWSVDEKGRWTFVNERAAKQIFGYEPSEMLGRPFYEFQPPEQGRKDWEVFNRVKSGERRYRYESVHLRRDGTLVHLRFNAIALCDETGRMIGATGMATDITERKQVEEALRRSEAVTRRILEVVPAGVIVISLDEEIIDINAEAQRVLDIDRDRLSSVRIEDFSGITIWEDGSMCRLEDYPVTKCLRTGAPQPPTVIGLRKSAGEVLWGMFSAVPFHDPETDRQTAVVLSILDVTRLKEAEDTARAAQETLLRQQQFQTEQVAAELNKVRGELIRSTRLATLGRMSAQIAHDIRNPLAAIRNAAYFLRRKLPQHEQQWHEYITLIEDEVHVCDQIINNLLEAARTKQPRKKWLKLEGLVSEAIGRLELPERIRFCYSADHEPFFIHADPIQLRRVFDNLLKNALEAIEEEGEIQVSACRTDEYDCILVRDTGVGIPDDKAETVFELFFTTKAKGTGLGLPICRQIVEGHGGTLEVARDRDWKGTTIELRLPRHGGSSPEN